MNVDNAKSLYSKFENDSTIQNFIAQANSRYILYNVNEPEENFPKYTDNLDVRCVSIAVNYLSMGYSFYEDDRKSDAFNCLNKASTILEHIYSARGSQEIFKEYYCIVAALGYYASSQYSKAFVILKKLEVDTVIAKLIKLLLTKRLSELHKVIDELIVETSLEKSIENEDDVIIRILAQYFLEMLSYVYSGQQEKLENANEIITDLIILAGINEDPALWWVFKLLKLVTFGYKDTSLWSTIKPIIQGNSELVEKYIESNVYKSTPVTELFRSQLDCLEKIKSDKGAVVSIPTSSGKTKLAEIAILKNLVEYPDSICLYIAPFRSLAYEVEESLSSTLGTIGCTLSHLYGSTQYTQLDKILIEDADVIIATPEKAKAIFRSNTDLIKKVKLVIVDEGHLIGNQKRYITNELFIEELKVSLRENDGKVVLLSAVLPNLSEFSRWITGEENHIANSEWRPSSQRLGILELVNNVVNLVWIGDYESYNNRFVESKLVRAERITSTGKVYPAKYFPETKKDAVAATAMKLLSLGSILIYVGRSNMVNSQARVVYKLMEEQNILHTWLNINDFELFKLACDEAYGNDSEVFKFAERGIICHSAKLPADVRLCIERLMSNGNPKIIIATSTLAQGVNIGISTVIISNIYLDGTAVVDVKDFWNIAGRAGRAFVDTEGKILYAIDRSRNKNSWQIDKQVDELKKYYDSNNIERAVSGVFGLLKELFNSAIEYGIDYETFLELIAENDVSGLNGESGSEYSDYLRNKFDMIDDTLLSLNIKYNSSELSDSSSWIDDCFRQSLAFISAESNNMFDEEKVIEILKARNRGVLKLAGNSSEWSTLANSSVSLRVSVAINEKVDEVFQHVSDYLSSDLSIESMMILIEYLDTLIIDLPAKDIRDFSNEGSDIGIIRQMFFSGSAMSEILKVDGKSNAICNDYYGFHFPWIVNALAKNMKKYGHEDEAKTLEYIALLAEIGLPDIASTKIYLSGVRSRESAVEISTSVDIDSDDSLKAIKEKLLCIQEHFEDYSLSERTGKLLEIINKKNLSRRKKEIKKSKINFLNKDFDSVNQVFIKKIDDQFYACSYDCKIHQKIFPKNKAKFNAIAGSIGLWFEKVDDGWILMNRNPYIALV